MPKRVEIVWNAKKICSYGTLISMDLADFSQVPKLRDIARSGKFDHCGESVFPRTFLSFGHLVDILDDYGSPKYNWNICIDGRDMSSQTRPSVAIVRLRDIARCSKFDHLWWGAISRTAPNFDLFVDMSDVCGYLKIDWNNCIDGRDIASQTWPSVAI